MSDQCPHCESDRIEMLGGWTALRCLECGYEWLHDDDDDEDKFNEEIRGVIRSCRMGSAMTLPKGRTSNRIGCSSSRSRRDICLDGADHYELCGVRKSDPKKWFRWSGGSPKLDPHRQRDPRQAVWCLARAYTHALSNSSLANRPLQRARRRLAYGLP